MIDIELSALGTIDPELSSIPALDCSLSTVSVQRMYTGEYAITPSRTVQTLQTSDKLLSGNIIINPIPSNYCLIAWSGSGIKIS